MHRSRTYDATGIILRSRPLGDTDRIAVLYSLEEGKLSAVAKGARRANSKLAAAVQPFAHGRFGLARGKSLDVVTQCRLAESFYELRVDLDRLTAACCVVELVDRAVEDRHPDADTFALLLGALRGLCPAPDPELILWTFGVQLLSRFGYRPVLGACSRCGSTESQGARFSPLFGGRLCGACLGHDSQAFEVTRDSVQLLRALVEGSAQGGDSPVLEDRTRHELRRVFRELIEHRLDLRLRSLEFADRVGG